jgi:hypothetical protein
VDKVFYIVEMFHIDAMIEHDIQCLVSLYNEDNAMADSARIHKSIQDCFEIKEDIQRILHEEAVQN